MEVNELKDENRKLKQMYADLALDHNILKMFWKKSFKPC
jgi:putative transposase